MKTRMILKIKTLSLLVILLLGSIGLKASDLKNERRTSELKIETDNQLVEEAPLELKAWMVSESYWKFGCDKTEWNQLKKEIITEEKNEKKGKLIELWMTNDKLWRLYEQKQ